MQKIISKLRGFNKKEENKELVKHSMLALFVRTGSAIAAFLMNVVVARYLGASEAGYFFLANTFIMLVATMGRIGADNAIMRYVSIYGVDEDYNSMHGIVAGINKIVLLITIALTVIICVFSRQISVYFFHKPELTWPLFFTALSTPFYALYNLLGMALQGRRKVLLSVTVLKILSPVIVVIMLLTFTTHDSATAAIYYTISSVLTLAIGFYWWFKNVPAGKGKLDLKILWKSCLPLWLGAIMQQLILWGGQFVAGIYNNPSELAYLSAARNTSVLITFILTAVNYVSAPRFASMYKQGKMKELKNYARNTSRLMTIIATPIVVVIWFFPGFIMSLFGKGYHDGFWLLRVLAIGQYINVITGSVGYLLIMSGYEADMLKIRVINGVGAIILAFILNASFGAIGSAISTAVAIAASNLMAVGLVKKRLGFNTLSIIGFK